MAASSSKSRVLNPGNKIKPQVYFDDVKNIINEIYGLKFASSELLNGYDDLNYHIMVEDYSISTNIFVVPKDGYVLKIINSLDSEKDEFFEAQTQMLLHLRRNNILCPRPIKTLDGKYFFHHSFPSGRHLVRLLEYIEGIPINHVPVPDILCYDVGEFAANIDLALQNFHHSAFTNHKSIWMLESVAKLEKFLYVIEDKHKKNLAQEVIKEFSSKVVNYDGKFQCKLEQGMIHGDINEQNILVEQNHNDDFVIKAILDFGDSQFSCYLFELAITMTYMILQTKNIDMGTSVLNGYYNTKKIPDDELKLLKICVAGRLIQSLVMGCYSIQQDPNNIYLVGTAQHGWIILEQIWKCSDENLLSRWKCF